MDATRGTLLVLAATLASGASSAGCGEGSLTEAENRGNVRLTITFAGGVTATTVDYSITRDNVVFTQGVIDVAAGEVKTATVVTGLPAGAYTASARAMTNAGPCSGSAPFGVVATRVETVNILMQCSRTVGTPSITEPIDQCPFLTAISASALQASVGSSITLGASATELDPGDVVTYTWTQTGPAVGTIDTPNAPTTTFTCDAEGTTSVSIAVSDGLCGDSYNITPITCTATAVDD